MAKGEGPMEASMVKAYVCKAAEWVTREAMQIHGGMGYAEEFPVSRLFVDARVLSIFEGADESAVPEGDRPPAGRDQPADRPPCGTLSGEFVASWASESIRSKSASG